jgi:manganese efflux pump family protein
MSFLSTSLLALGMSADAFAVAAGKGAELRRPRPFEAFRVGAIFGTIEVITPLIGWCLGFVASSYVAAVDHWIAFFLLGGIGAKMIHESFAADTALARPRRHKLSDLILAGIGSSIDALAVGMTLALIGGDILVTAFAIGCTTFIMATLGIFIGHYAGNRLGNTAELIGGVILIGIGTHILLGHLGYIGN